MEIITAQTAETTDLDRRCQGCLVKIVQIDDPLERSEVLSQLDTFGIATECPKPGCKVFANTSTLDSDGACVEGHRFRPVTPELTVGVSRRGQL